MFYTITNRDGQATLSVIADDFEKVVPSSHPNYAALVTYFANTPESEHDEDHVRGLVDPTVGIGRVLQEHFGDRLTYDLHHLYLDGAKMDGTLASLVKQRLMSADQDWLRFAKFLVNLDSNPSYRAQQAVWKWVEANGLTITEDGRFLGYKAVQDDGKSSSAGPNNYVNGVLLNDGESCRVPHEIGSVISKKRADVDDSPGGGCSVGLHVGTYTYAKDFAPVLMTVAVNPRDVVSADQSAHDVKIRVCEYEVVSLNEDKVDFIGKTTSSDLDQPALQEVTGEPATPWKVVEFDNLGTTVLESFETREAAEEALEGYVEDEPEGDYDVQHVDAEGIVSDPEDVEEDAETVREIPTLDEDDFEGYVEEDEDEDILEAQTLVVTVDGSPVTLSVPDKENTTLSDWADLNPPLKADLHDPKQGHKPVARKWADITSEASVRRYRNSNGIGLTLKGKIQR